MGEAAAAAAQKPLLIGEAPNASSRDRGDTDAAPLSGRPAVALLSMMGEAPADPSETDYRCLVRHFNVANLLIEPPEQWTAAVDQRARTAARAMVINPVTIFLGRNVSRAFLLSGMPFFRWERLTHNPGRGPFSWVAVIPHPSGLNRLYNDPLNRQQAGETLRQALKMAKEHR